MANHNLEVFYILSENYLDNLKQIFQICLIYFNNLKHIFYWIPMYVWTEFMKVIVVVKGTQSSIFTNPFLHLSDFILHRPPRAFSSLSQFARGADKNENAEEIFDGNKSPLNPRGLTRGIRGAKGNIRANILSNKIYGTPKVKKSQLGRLSITSLVGQ